MLRRARRRASTSTTAARSKGPASRPRRCRNRTSTSCRAPRSRARCAARSRCRSASTTRSPTCASSTRCSARKSRAGGKRLARKTSGSSGLMGRRDAVLALLALGAAPLTAGAQQAVKVARIGYLSPNLAANPNLRVAFREGLRDLGYVEGRNVVIEFRDGEGSRDRLTTLAAGLVTLKVDVIVTEGGTLGPS